jgi:predicted DNA-binding protein (UPF0251 family)
MGSPAARQAVRVRSLVDALELSQVAAARELDVSDRTMRRYCAGEPVPRVVILALERLLELKAAPK